MLQRQKKSSLSKIESTTCHSSILKNFECQSIQKLVETFGQIRPRNKKRQSCPSQDRRRAKSCRK